MYHSLYLRLLKSILLAFIICNNVKAQLAFYNNDISLNPVLINPATCGSEYLPKAALSHFKQWSNIASSPKSFSISGEIRLGKFDFYNPKMLLNETKFKSKERIGIGAGIFANTYGPFSEINFLGTYSYHIPITINSSLSFGLSVLFNHMTVNNAEIKPRETDDQLIVFRNKNSANASFGLYYNHNKYFAGLSFINLFNSSFNPAGNYNNAWDLYFLGGYRFNTGLKSFIIEPSFTYCRHFESKLNEIDYNIKFYLVDYGWLNLSYLSDNQFTITTAIRLYKSFYVSYSFTNINLELNYYAQNIHGIIIGKNLGVNRHTSLLH